MPREDPPPAGCCSALGACGACGPAVWLWPPAWLDVPPEPACPVDWLVEHPLATQTGTNAPIGAVAATAGLTEAESTCTAPTDPETLWPAGRLCPPPVVEAVEPAAPVDWFVEHALTTQTGTDAVAGAATETAGVTLVELACTAPIDWDTDWPFPASAGAAVARATRQANSVSMSFIVFSFRFRTCD